MSNENLPNEIENIPTAEVEEMVEESTSAQNTENEPETVVENIPSVSDSVEPVATEEQVSRTLQDDDDTDNFLPTQTHTWYYSLRDLVDEVFWGVIFMAVWIGLFFNYPTSSNGLMAYNILTVLFAVGILYFSILHNPLKIFFRKNDPKNPHPHRLGKEMLAFAILVLGVAVFFYRIPANFAKQVTPPESVTQEVAETTEVTETTQSVTPTEIVPVEEAPVETTPVDNTPTEVAPPESVLTEIAPATELKSEPESVLESELEPTAELELEPTMELGAEPITEPAEPTDNPVVEPVEAQELPEPSQDVPTENVPTENVLETPTESQSTITTLVDDTETVTETEDSVTTEKATEASEITETTETVKKASWSVADGVRYTLLVTFGVFTWGYWINLAVRIFFNRICTRYELTPVLLIYKNGFFVTKVRHIAIWDIAQVNVSRNLWQRILGVGTVELRIRDHGLEETDENSDVPDNIILLNGLENPQEVKDLINTYRLFIRRRMGRRFLNHVTK